MLGVESSLKKKKNNPIWNNSNVGSPDISGIALNKISWGNMAVLNPCPFPSDKSLAEAVWRQFHGHGSCVPAGLLSMNTAFMFGIDHNNIHWQINFYNFAVFLSVWCFQGINMDFDFYL